MQNRHTLNSGVTAIAFCLCCALGTVVQAAQPVTDVLYMRHGEEYVGRLQHIGQGRMLFEVAGEGLRAFQLSQIQRVELGRSRPGSGWRTAADVADPVLLEALDAGASVDSLFPSAGYVTLYKEHLYVLYPDGAVKNTERVIQKVLLERGKRVANGTLHYLSKDSQATLDFGRCVTPDGNVVPVSDSAVQDGNVYSDFPDYQNLHRKNWALRNVREGAVVDYQTTVFKQHPLMPFHVDVAFGDREPTLREILRVVVPSGVACLLDTLRFGRGTYSSTAEGDSVIRIWTIEDQPELTVEDAMPAGPDIWPRVALAPEASWPKLGAAYAKRLDKPLERDKALKKQVKSLTKSSKSLEDKARALYTFVAKQIRSIPVPYHHYSLEPKPIRETYRRRYGNNLDKSLLFLGMLQQAGVRADLCLIRPQGRGALMSVPSLLQFTECVVRVDLGDRIVFANVSDDRVPFGALDGDCQNVKGLLVDKRHARLITTPLLAADQEREERTVRSVLSPEGDLRVYEEARYVGHSAKELRSLKVMKEEELTRTFQRAVSSIHPKAEMLRYRLSDLDDLESPAGYVLEYRITGYALSAGGELLAFRVPDLDYTASNVGKPTRVHPLDWTTRVLETSHYTFEIPAGFKVYHLPAASAHESQFLKYEARFGQQDGEIVFSDRFRRIAVQAPASAYAGYKEAIEARAQVAKEWIVLERE